jgi:uncharacterized repeat protein (TIGR03803 family)
MPLGSYRPLLICRFSALSEPGANSTTVLFAILLTYSTPFLSTVTASGRAKMIDVGGTLYGTTYWGGAHQLGTVFSITPSGEERVVYSLARGRDGEHPGGAPLISVNGVLYGTTPSGGTRNHGTIFKIDGSGHESVLYNFKGGTDGEAPDALFVLSGSLYGTTHAGGNFSDCLVFEVACGTFFRTRP